MLYFFSFGISRPNFEDYKESVVFTKLSEEVEISDKGTHYLKIVGEIDNQSKETWKRPTFKVNFFDETGEFKTLIYERDHYVSIAPKTKEKVAFKILIGKNKSDYNYKVELEDMSQY